MTRCFRISYTHWQITFDFDASDSILHRYFILWLREYKTRYTTWRRQSKPSSPIRCSSNPDARTYRSQSAPPPPNPALTQFYLRAKETFLTPFAPYALPVPLDVLAPFYSSIDAPGYRPPEHLLGVPGQNIPPPPYPEVFEEVEERVVSMLSDSLDRFVVATFHNVGMPRAYCGCAGGTVIGLTGRWVPASLRRACEHFCRSVCGRVTSRALHSAGYCRLHMVRDDAAWIGRLRAFAGLLSA